MMLVASFGFFGAQAYDPVTRQGQTGAPVLGHQTSLRVPSAHTVSPPLFLPLPSRSQ